MWEESNPNKKSSIVGSFYHKKTVYFDIIRSMVANTPEKERVEPKYVSFDDGSARGFGRVDELFGKEDDLFADYRVDKTLYWVKGESLVGNLIVGDDTFQLRADAMYRVIRFIQTDMTTNEPTGKGLFLLYRDLGRFPFFSTFFTSQAGIEKIEPSWPDGVDFPQDSFVGQITNPRAKTILVDVEALWKERGGDPKHKLPKTGGRKFKNP